MKLPSLLGWAISYTSWGSASSWASAWQAREQAPPCRPPSNRSPRRRKHRSRRCTDKPSSRGTSASGFSSSAAGARSIHGTSACWRGLGPSPHRCSRRTCWSSASRSRLSADIRPFRFLLPPRSAPSFSSLPRASCPAGSWGQGNSCSPPRYPLPQNGSLYRWSRPTSSLRSISGCSGGSARRTGLESRADSLPVRRADFRLDSARPAPWSFPQCWFDSRTCH